MKTLISILFKIHKKYRSAQVLQSDIPSDPLDPRSMGSEFKKEGVDMLVVYNPEVSRTLDVEPMETLYFDRRGPFLHASTSTDTVES